MIKTVPFLIILGFLTIVTSPVFAETKIEVSGNGEGAKTNIRVNSNSSVTTVNKNTTSDNKTKIHIESNGEKKSYVSESGEAVTMESADGNVKVNINNTKPQVTTRISESSKTKTSVNVKTNLKGKTVKAQKPTMETRENMIASFFAGIGKKWLALFTLE